MVRKVLLCLVTAVLILSRNAEATLSVEVQRIWQEATLVENEHKKLIVEKKKLAELMAALKDKTFKEEDRKKLETQQALVDAQNRNLEAVIDATSLKGPTETTIINAISIVNKKSKLDELGTQMLTHPKETQAVLAKTIEGMEADLTTSAVNATKLNERERIDKEADTRFAGFGFGVAIGLTVKAGNRDLVQSATLDANKIVRVERDNNSRANFLLETHYLFTPNAPFLPWIPFFNVEAKQWGHGPFVAVQPGTDNIIESVGIGWMLGFKRSRILATDTARQRGDSFNLGAGVLVNPNAQVLGDGVVKNQPLPSNETDVRLKKTTEIGWLVVFSYSF